MTAKQGIIGRRYVVVDGKKYEQVPDIKPGYCLGCDLIEYRVTSCTYEDRCSWGHIFKRMEEE